MKKLINSSSLTYPLLSLSSFKKFVTLDSVIDTGFLLGVTPTINLDVASASIFIVP